MEVRSIRRWPQLIVVIASIWPSVVFAQNTHFEEAKKLARSNQWQKAHVAFEKAWNTDPNPIVAYSWCMAMHDAKDAAKKKVSCALVDASKLDSARQAKFKAVTAKATTPPTKNEDNSNCKNNTGNCGNTTTITNNDNRQINAETENVRMTSWGYTGIAMMVVGAASTFWLFQELDVIDNYNAQGRAAQSKTELDALVEPHRNAQWRGRFALLGALVFGIGGTVLFVNDVLSVETRVKSASIRVSPAFVQVRW